MSTPNLGGDGHDLRNVKQVYGFRRVQHVSSPLRCLVTVQMPPVRDRSMVPMRASTIIGNFSITLGNLLFTSGQRAPLMIRRYLWRPLDRDPDAVILGE
jgi:hypothetical protein